ncbi:MAG: hypothetical protein NUV91_10245, partial [Candidatus Omnitrophica bacterium]|nr:hypothetical protein [Candidatus Omnitrophota bacterium]
PLKTSLEKFVFGYGFEENRQVIAYLKDHLKEGDRIIINTSAEFPFAFYSAQLGLFYQYSQQELVMFPSDHCAAFQLIRLADFLESDQGNPVAMLRKMAFCYNSEGYVKALLYNPQKLYAIEEKDHLVLQGRLWLLFSRIPSETKDFFLEIMDRSGEKIKSLEMEGASLYLYENES